MLRGLRHMTCELPRRTVGLTGRSTRESPEQNDLVADMALIYIKHSLTNRSMKVGHRQYPWPTTPLLLSRRDGAVLTLNRPQALQTFDGALQALIQR